ncbi:MAG: dihydrolipoyl dehydrogenase [Coriobacteriales bacterium]|jgi:dihydrolipoamide dehydrogenase|nr:dihydrolipoyl dehydrogenase [Coriobacteriales bacterium]
MTKLAIIGGGPGGYVAAIRAAQLGGDVTVIEKGELGGTCLNAGCIPTKALLHAAGYLTMAQKASLCGVTLNASLDFAKTQAYKAGVVAQLVVGVTGLLKANKVRTIKGEASFTERRTLQVKAADGSSEQIEFDKAIIASGSTAIMPPIPGLDLPVCMDSTDALALAAVPKSMVVIGGGVIGVEMATAYAAFGTQVTIVEMMDRIVPLIDREMGAFVRSKLEAKGIAVMTEAKLLSVQEHNKVAEVSVEAMGSVQTLSAERVLVAIGRRADTESLNLEGIGIAANRGCIVVDSRQRTSVEGIYAIGDCTGGTMLAHVASQQGEAAAENALGHYVDYDGKTVPSCVYTDPELASVGLSEEQAKERGVDYIVGRFPLAANGKSLVMGSDGLVKIIAGKRYGEILGVHIVGPRATDLIVEGALAIGLEATLDELIATVHAHPTVGEALREAALAAQGRAIHMPNK